MIKNRRQYLKIPLISLIIFLLLLLLSLETKAADKAISISGLSFDDHIGMMSIIDNEYVYCIGRGKPFRSSVSDLQMVTSTFQQNFGDATTGTIAANIRTLMAQLDSDAHRVYYFRCWGTATLNGDHTNATPTNSTDGVPSSEAWNEAFTEFREDDEDKPYLTRYTLNEVDKSYWSIQSSLTGHENSKKKYATMMTEVDYSKVGFSEAQYYALGMVNYYCWEDPDSDTYSDKTRYKTKQAMAWAIQFGFISTSGSDGSDLMLVYKDSTGKYGLSGTNTYTGNCDGYIKITIGSDYEAMKLYRQIVWKTTNMRQIPSFASYNYNTAPTIKLYWDKEKNAYTTTISDANGVLKYFDFNVDVSGVTINNNGDGTLTITSQSEIVGTPIVKSDASKLEPANGVFKLPTFYVWSLQGKSVTFKYAALAHDADTLAPKYYYIPAGLKRVQAYGIKYNHSYYYSPMCNWFCTNGSKVTHCTNSKNSSYHTSNTCNAGWDDPCDCDICDSDCDEDHTHHYSCYQDHHHL